jgi:lipopolysaccharide transport system ATP-binding protein
MSSDVVIRAEGLGKKYMIGHQSGERYTSLRDVMAQTARNFARTAGDMFSGKAIIAGDEVEEFWALKDVSFEINRGDVVGIIGRNGAGKSTLLKVLSRITEPSEGRVEIKGRVASLLEVGTGFHPELTGRENIYLNGAILGMTREEIKGKFDEIVDFSGVEKFLDTPVKRYSSGMYVRLAFAVAAHLEPEILIVDEVLAVGDAEFQKRCLGKMKEVVGHGRTVLFVSHNLAAVASLCNSGILLSEGKITRRGSIIEAIKQYSVVRAVDATVTFPVDERSPRIAGVRVDPAAAAEGRVVVDVTVLSPHPISTPHVAITLRAPNGVAVWSSSSTAHGIAGKVEASQLTTIRCCGCLPLYASDYSLSVWFGEWPVAYDAKIDCLTFALAGPPVPLGLAPIEVVGHLSSSATWNIC